jgi:beta-1,4-mannosyltransferase
MAIDNSKTLWCFPLNGIAYNACLSQALTDLGINVQAGVWSGNWLRKNVKRNDSVLINWPSFLYADNSNRFYKYALCLKYAFFLAILKLWGVRIGWIAHNLLPHKRSEPPWIDIVMRYVTITCCSVVFCHGRSNRVSVSERFSIAEKKSVEIIHGNFMDLYPRVVDRNTARKKLGIPESAFVLLSFGSIQPYKGYELLPREISKFSDRNMYYLIAGPAPDKEYENEVRFQCEKYLKGRSQILSDYIPDEEVQYYLLSCDAMIMPYLDSFTSGTAVLALSFGRLFVAPASGFTEELIGDRWGALYAPDDPTGLYSAIERVRDKRVAESELLNIASTLDWSKTATIISDALCP